jgi:putative hydrolase
VEDFDPLGNEDPFSGLPFLNDMIRSLGSQGGQSARQIAMAVASNGESEPNVDPTVRIEFEALARVAELHVADHMGLPPSRSGSLSIEPLTRAGWAAQSVDALRPLLGVLAHPPTVEPSDMDMSGNESTRWFGELMAAVAPLMAEVTAGTLVGQLASRSLGSYDLPIPREKDRILLIAPNIASFAEDWSLPSEDIRLWICLHEVAHHAVLGVPHVREILNGLLSEHAAGFRNDPSNLVEHLEGIDLAAGPEALASLQGLLDPESVLSVVRSPEQLALLPRLEALVAAVIGFVDHTMDQIGQGLIKSYPMVTEALRRRRVSTGSGDRFVERILGLDLTQEQVDRGAAFVAGVVDRAGSEGLERLWVDGSYLPTPSEVDAPGLWLARIDLPSDS